jgi:hypothetical protein
MDSQVGYTLPTPLEEQVEETVRRDQWGRPKILQADGITRIGYNRASSFGGQIDDKTNVEKWAKRQVVRGLAMDPTLLGRVPRRLLFDPWLDQNQDEKKILDSLVEQAQDIAGSNLKSALGTEIHLATELVDKGDSLEDALRDVPEGRRKLLIERGNAYHKATREYGFRHDLIEQFGVQDEVKVAGTIDRLSYVPFWPAHPRCVVDVKTSSSLDFAGITFAVQLATYAHMDDYDPVTETRSPREGVDPDRALIIHVDRNYGGHVTFAEVNIERGWAHAHLARQIIDARRVGKQWVNEISETEMAVYGAASRAELLDVVGDGRGWTKELKELARKRWTELN